MGLVAGETYLVTMQMRAEFRAEPFGASPVRHVTFGWVIDSPGGDTQTMGVGPITYADPELQALMRSQLQQWADRAVERLGVQGTMF